MAAALLKGAQTHMRGPRFGCLASPGRQRRALHTPQQHQPGALTCLAAITVALWYCSVVLACRGLTGHTVSTLLTSGHGRHSTRARAAVAARLG